MFADCCGHATFVAHGTPLIRLSRASAARGNCDHWARALWPILRDAAKRPPLWMRLWVWRHPMQSARNIYSLMVRRRACAVSNHGRECCNLRAAVHRPRIRAPLRGTARDAAERDPVQQIVAGHAVGDEAVESPQHGRFQLDQPSALTREGDKAGPLGILQ